MALRKQQVMTADVGWHPQAGCQGFALWVRPNGARVWCLDYRFHGRQRRITLGRAESLPADEALKIARKHRVEIDHGRDPLEEKADARKAEAANVTLADF